jgi:hypothetical protein
MTAARRTGAAALAHKHRQRHLHSGRQAIIEIQTMV